MGDHLSPRVARLQGWGYVFVGAASLVLMALAVALPSLLADANLPVRSIVDLVALTTVLLVVCGTVPFVWSVVLAHRRG